MIERLRMWLWVRLMWRGYVAVSTERLLEYADAERELAMFKRHLSHRWLVRIRNREAQAVALENLMSLGYAEGDENAFAYSEGDDHSDADLTESEVYDLEVSVGRREP